MRFSQTILILLLLFGGTSLNAQDDDNWENYFDHVQISEFYPMIEANIGITKPMRKTFRIPFSQIGHAELKLGYSELRQYKAYIWQLDDRYLFSTYIHPDLDFTNVEMKKGDIQLEATRFGLGNRLGYGYTLGSITLVPYNTNALTFIRLSFTNTDRLGQDDISLLNRYTNGYQFGISTEAGIKAKLFKSLSAGASCEWNITYPVVIFPQWLGSFMIMQTSISFISIFSRNIIRHAPLVGPLIYFALKNGLGYLFYIQMKENMHWPFNSEQPLTMETLRFGLSLTF
jgi:hypothetical protein